MGRLLGSGGFGSVYLATDERLQRSVAVKICSTRRLPAHEADEASRLFQSEALTLARLRHPGLTAIWDYFNQDKDWFLVMEYVPGETLRDLLRRVSGPLPQAEAFEYARQLCAVLGYLHHQHSPIVFRDLKPANVIVTPEGRLKLIDFGIARLFSPDKSADTAQFGTPGYAPPEQYGGQTEPRSDIYTLGVVLHQMLTGHNPTSSPFALPPVRQLNPAIPQEVEALIQRATAYEIEDRIATAEEFCRLLDAATQRQVPALTAPVPLLGSPSTAAPSTPISRPVWSPTPRPLPNRPQSGGIGRGLILILLLMVLLGSLGVGAYMLKSQINTFVNDFLKPVVVASPTREFTTPELTIFSVRGNGQSENLYAKLNNNVRQITPPDPNVKYILPAISPDGKRIAFTKETGLVDDAGNWHAQTSEVWVMNADGTDARLVYVPNYSFTRAPAWSPDQQWLAIEVATDNKRVHNDLALVHLDSTEVRLLAATKAWEGGPTWSPDGTRVAFHARLSGKCMQLFVVDVDGGVPRQLTDLSSEGCTPSNDGDFWPDWSPDGQQIAFGRKLKGQEQVALLNVETGSVQLIEQSLSPSGHPRWSADGKYLLFEHGKQDAVTLVQFDIEHNTITPFDTSYAGSRLADWH